MPGLHAGKLSLLLLLSGCVVSSPYYDRTWIKIKLSSGEVVKCRAFAKMECGMDMFVCGEDYSKEYRCQKDFKIISWRLEDDKR